MSGGRAGREQNHRVLPQAELTPGDHKYRSTSCQPSLATRSYKDHPENSTRTVLITPCMFVSQTSPCRNPPPPPPSTPAFIAPPLVVHMRFYSPPTRFLPPSLIFTSSSALLSKLSPPAAFTKRLDGLPPHSAASSSVAFHSCMHLWAGWTEVASLRLAL